MANKKNTNTILEKIAYDLNNNPSIAILLFLITVFGAAYFLLNIFVIQPKNDEIAKLRHEASVKNIYVYNINNNTIKVPEMKTQNVSPEATKEQIDYYFKNALNKTPILINDVPSTLDDSKVSQKTQNQYVIATSSSTTFAKTNIDFLGTLQGDSWTFTPFKVEQPSEPRLQDLPMRNAK
jgi:hypothetical protein